ncbi:hypothetical protein [Actinoplanes awajinensis]|uniref:hypothetical protein n=1 Tax=Actinoplanes awajinensis TaxID=135946 RepID=UPI0012FB36E9|nr:hypothetical protein [Actinoplanes awajinensis]
MGDNADRRRPRRARRARHHGLAGRPSALRAAAGAPGRVEPAVRSGHRFLINRTDEPVDLGIDGFLPPRGVQIIPR